MKWPIWTPWRPKAGDDSAQQEIALPVSLSGMDYRSVPTAGSNVHSLDGALIAVVAGLLLWGLVMVYSASIALPENPRFANYAPTHFVVRHGISLTVGLLGALLAFQLPMNFWQRAAPTVFAVALLLLVAVLIPGIGKGVNGARRWINLGVLNFQPSELAKVAVLLYASDYVVRRAELVKTSFWKSVWPMAMVVAIVGILLLAEPDMGALMVIAMIAVLIMVLGGVEARQSLLIFLVLGLTFAFVIATSEWRRQRIFAYLDPWSEAHALGKGYQLTHSLIALGRGQIFGVGLGGSVEKLHWLPEAHTDFLLAVIGEEFGFLGVLTLIALFFWLTRRMMLIGRTAVALGRSFSGWVAQGVGIWIGGQSLINIGVNVGALPTKGLTLPLMSYGGSAVLMNLIAIAIVLRVDMENKRLMRGERLE